jgi:hypothetical protein
MIEEKSPDNQFSGSRQNPIRAGCEAYTFVLDGDRIVAAFPLLQYQFPVQDERFVPWKGWISKQTDCKTCRFFL